MAIFKSAPVVMKPDTAEEKIGFELYMLSKLHWLQLDGQPGLSLGYEGCNAAVAIKIDEASVAYAATPDGGPDDATNKFINEMQFRALHGSSRLYAGGDKDYNAERKKSHGDEPNCDAPFSNSAKKHQHAEQTAILAAQVRGLAFWESGGHAHIYIDFSPCEDCAPWLTEREESWYVHYRSELKNKSEAIADRKEIRSEVFGRQMEKKGTGGKSKKASVFPPKRFQPYVKK